MARQERGEELEVAAPDRELPVLPERVRWGEREKKSQANVMSLTFRTT
jgi:hypothetical protein